MRSPRGRLYGGKDMGTYRQIQDWVKERHGFKPKTCWIAHCKELCGLPKRDAPNRQGEQRVQPCPPEKQAAIEEALGHFGMLRPARQPMGRGIAGG